MARQPNYLSRKEPGEEEEELEQQAITMIIIIIKLTVCRCHNKMQSGVVRERRSKWNGIWNKYVRYDDTKISLFSPLQRHVCL